MIRVRHSLSVIYHISQFAANIHTNSFHRSTQNKSLNAIFIKQFRELVEKNQIQKAKESLERISKNKYLYDAAIDVCFRAKEFQMGLQIFEQMIHEKLKPTSHTFSFIILGYANVKDVKSAEKWFHDMKLKFYVNPDDYCRNALLKAYCTEPDVKRARLFFDKIDDKTATTYNMMISRYLSHPINTYLAKRLFQQMIDSGIKPDQFTFSKMIWGCAQKKDVNTAQKLFDMMNDYKLMPDTAVHNALLEAYCNANELIKARALFDVINQKDVITYSIMVDGYVSNIKSESDIESAIEILDMLISSNIRHGTEIEPFNSIMNSLAQRGDSKKATNILRKMRKHSIRPNSRTYASLIEALFKDGKIGEAAHVFARILPRYKNIITYNVMLEGLFLNYNLRQAENVFKDMQSAGIGPNAVTIGIMIDGYLKTGEEKQALDLIDNMEKLYQIKPIQVINRNWASRAINTAIKIFERIENKNVAIYSNIINQLVKANRMQEVKKYLQQISKDNIELSRHTLNVIIDGYIKQGELVNAYEVYQNMQNAYFIQPNADTLNVLLQGLIKKQYIEWAWELFHKISDKDISTYNSMIEGCIQIEGDLDKVMELWDDLLGAGLKPDVDSFRIIITALINDKQKGKAEELYHQMTDMGLRDNDIIKIVTNS